MIDRNCLSYWFPKLVDAAIPVPRTEIVTTDLELIRVLYGRPSGPDAEAFDAAYRAFLREVAHHADSIGFPCFLRTGQTSGKHEWKNTCFLPDAEQIMKSVPALIEFSALADMMGLRTNVWAIREYLPVEPVAVLPRYGDMPLVPEMRCFINKGEILCTHFY